MAAPEARFESGKEQTEMLLRHIGPIYIDTHYSFL